MHAYDENLATRSTSSLSSERLQRHARRGCSPAASSSSSPWRGRSMSKPKLLLLDEPSLGLAPEDRLAHLRAVQQLRAEGVTILLVEQNVRAALVVADRAYVLQHRPARALRAPHRSSRSRRPSRRPTSGWRSRSDGRVRLQLLGGRAAVRQRALAGERLRAARDRRRRGVRRRGADQLRARRGAHPVRLRDAAGRQRGLAVGDVHPDRDPHRCRGSGADGAHRVPARARRAARHAAAHLARPEPDHPERPAAVARAAARDDQHARLHGVDAPYRRRRRALARRRDDPDDARGAGRPQPLPAQVRPRPGHAGVVGGLHDDPA